MPAPTRSSAPRSLLAALALVCLSAVLAAPAAQAAPVRQPAPLPLGPAARVGTWNVELAPWLVPAGSPQEQAVIDRVAGSGLDVLALQGVWTQQAQERVLADPRVKTAYPYSYATGALQLPSRSTSVSRTEQENWINCLIGRGVDTRTVVQPATATDPACSFLGLNVELLSQPAFECLSSTLATLPNGQPALAAIDICAAAQGVKYQYGGRAGQLVLSNRPISAVSETAFATFGIRRVNVFATVGGLRYAFVDGPNNEIADADPGLGPLQTGALQPEVLQDVLDHAPDVVAGSLNTGPDYQPEGYQLLLDNGYTSPAGPAATPTFCPAGSAFPQCAPDLLSFEARNGPAPRTIDHVLSSPTARCSSPGAFAVTPPLSRHIAVTAVCAPVLAPELAVRLTLPTGGIVAGTSFPATLTVTDNGPVAARSVVSGLTLPAGLTVQAAPGGRVTSDRRSVGYAASTLAGRASVSYALTLTLDPTATGGSVTAATASLATRESYLRNNVVRNTLDVRQASAP